MRFSHLALLFLIFAFAFTISFAQTDEEKAKEKQVRQIAFLEQVLADAKNLRLPENRALVFAKVGNALWQTNEKRARELFQNSIAELIAAQAEAENEKGNKQNLNTLIYGQSPRWEILNLIASRDAEFALDALIKTRPAKITQALANFTGDNQSQSQQFARSEIQNEQRLINAAADKNPQRAVKLLRENLKKDVSYETVNLLKKIYQKDAETAKQLAEEVGQKLLDTKLVENYQDTSFIQYFLGEFGRENSAAESAQLKVSDQMLRNLAGKISAILLSSDYNSFYISPDSLKTIERFSPDNAAKIKQKQAKLESQNRAGQNQNYSKLMQNNDASPEELLSQAEKFPRSYRNEIYRRAAEKTAQNGNVEQAQKIITGNFSDEEAERYLAQFNANLAQQAISQGKFEEANSLINQISEESIRISSLTYLATTIYQKNPKENQKWATQVLEQARALVSDSPETFLEMNLLVTLASAYAQIEPAQAFRIIESLISPLNEFSEANAVIAKFGRPGNFRHGEYWVNAGNNFGGVYNLQNVLQNLKDKDFDRAVQFINNFSRLDTRVAFELQLIDSNLPINSAGRMFNFSSYPTQVIRAGF